MAHHLPPGPLLRWHDRAGARRDRAAERRVGIVGHKGRIETARKRRNAAPCSATWLRSVKAMVTSPPSRSAETSPFATKRVGWPKAGRQKGR